MGEARRRRLAGSQLKPVPYIDAMTGERKLGRNAGDPLEFLDKWRDRQLADMRGEHPAADVACDGCTACCYHKFVDIQPELEREEDLAHLDIITRDDGKLQLRKREDGACVHLGPNGCQVYEHRPRSCRLYDCRIGSLAITLDTFDGDRHPPVWMFPPRTDKGRAVIEAFRVVALSYAAQMQKEEGRNPTADEAFNYAVIQAPQVAGAIYEMHQLPPEEQIKRLGFDPRSLTQEDRARFMREMMGAAS
jgi:Putative zinc- or iron-chelating domain